MLRRLVVLVSLLVAMGALIAVQPARAAARGAECQVNGSATISPGLTTAAKAQSVTLSPIKLTNCHIGSAAAAGVPKAISGSATITPNPVSSKGSCASSALKNLTATITWSTGTTTTTTFSTTSLTGETAIQGKVVSSTDPNLKPGDLTEGDVVFKPTTTAQNCAKVPVTAVTFTGVIAAGSPK
jgi:hypothetical protein